MKAPVHHAAVQRVVAQNGNISSLSPSIRESIPLDMPPPIENLSNDESDGPSDGESLKARDITEEDAQSIFQVSISRAATHLTSAKTPAAEKAAAFEDRPGGYFDEDSVLRLRPEVSTPPGVTEDNNTNDENERRGRTTQVAGTHKSKPSLTLTKVPDLELQDQGLPSPWRPGAKNLSVGGRMAESRAALQEAFGPLKKRSLSGSGDALKKFLPKGLPSMPSMPSMPKASSFMPSAPSFFSSSSQSKNSGRTMSLQGSGDARVPAPSSATRNCRSSTMFSPTSPIAHNDLVRPQTLRRVTSQDSSLHQLYHTPSRSSSLGDDSRWVNVSEQVNSRGKAIFDSIQDRASFKMPSVNMPSMPSFNFNINFFSAAQLPYERGNTNTPDKGILPGVRKPGSSPDPSNRKVDNESSSHVSEDPLDRALSKLTGDIVVMGGYRGSILRSAKTHRQVWVPVKVGLNIRKVNLEVGLSPEDEEKMENHIYPSGMLQNIGPVDISKRLFKRLRDSPNAKNGTLRVHDYGYDWRLSPHLLSRQLAAFLEGLQCNQTKVPPKDRGAFLISHSLGGLITRHVINERPELVSGVIYAGVPHACVNILGPLRNGDAVLFSSRVLTAQVNFTLRTSFVLLPEDGRCFKDIRTGEEYPVDFFDPEEWIKYRWSPCTDPPLPPILPPQNGLTNLIHMSSSLTNLPLIGNKKSASNRSPERPSTQHQHSPPMVSRAANFAKEVDGGKDRTLAMDMGGSNGTNGKSTSNYQQTSSTSTTSTSVATTVTIPRPDAITYLTRVLADTKLFKSQLHFRPKISQQNLYPPAAIIYGKETPTCAGAKILGREGIPCADSYDNLAFGSGDGVVLAKEAMLPEGYHCVKGGRVSSDRGHVTLLGDLKAVGRAMEAVIRGRERGIGLGVKRHGPAAEGGKEMV